MWQEAVKIILLFFILKKNQSFINIVHDRGPRAQNMQKNSIQLIWIYARNSRAENCKAKITIIPKRNDLIYAKRNHAGRNLFYIDFEKKSWMKHRMMIGKLRDQTQFCSTYCANQIPLNEHHHSQFITEMVLKQ